MESPGARFGVQPIGNTHRERYRNGRMYEIIRLDGQPFHQPRVRRPQRTLISFKRVGAALLLIFGTLALVALVGWLAYGTVLLKMRAAGNEAEAQYKLGKRNLRSGVSPQDRLQAVTWIRLAAEQGHANAQTTLGFLYAKGTAFPQDSTLAAKWFRKGAMQDDAVAQIELAAMYATGKGVARDLHKAVHWYTRAAANGSEIARVNLALAQAASFASLGNLTTRKGAHYTRVSLRAIDQEGIMIAYDSGKGAMGLVKLKRNDLPDNLRQLCQYTSKKIAVGAGSPPWL
jgi:hypothetical protein